MKPIELVVLFVVSAALAAGLLFAFRMEPGAVGPAGEKAAAKEEAPKVRYSKSGYDVTPLSKERVEELSKKLSAEDARVILRKGTEAPFCGNLLDNKEAGTYCCKLCGLPLFSSGHKFNSGTGWPSFYQPVDPAHVRNERDASHGMVRVEILCARCGGHLGHVFDDGPKPTGLRYCLNSASLVFFKEGAEMPAESRPVETKSAYFAGGCFWGVEDRFQQVPGVVEAVSGYMGGTVASPTYKQVCYTETGHAETVKVVFDPARVTYRQLVEKFFRFHDPTTLNRQGPDVGTQYRSAIFAADEEQLRTAREVLEATSALPKYKGRKIVTQVVGPKEAGTFWEAEEYHQDYHAKHGGHCALPPDE